MTKTDREKEIWNDENKKQPSKELLPDVGRLWTKPVRRPGEFVIRPTSILPV